MTYLLTTSLESGSEEGILVEGGDRVGMTQKEMKFEFLETLQDERTLILFILTFVVTITSCFIYFCPIWANFFSLITIKNEESFENESNWTIWIFIPTMILLIISCKSKPN